MNADLNVTDFLLADKVPGRTAVRTLSRDHSYGELKEASEKIGRWLLARGMRKGDRVLLVAENSFFWIAAYLGILRAGAVAVPLPPTTLQEELRYYIEHTQAKCLIATAQHRARYGSETGELPVLVDDDSSYDAASCQPASLEPGGAGECAEWPHVCAGDLAALMFTSGSTGQPRGVMVSHGNILANTGSIVEALSLTAEDRMMTVLPLHYCFGTSLLHTHLRVGGQLVIDTRFAFPELVLRRMQETECTGFAGVPSHYQILLRNSSLRKKALPKLRHLQQAGGHLAPSFLRDLRMIFPEVKIHVMYGQTEATARLACLAPEALESRMGSIGKPIPGITLRLLDPAGNEVPPGEIGEIVAEGANISPGYWCSPEETAASFRNGRLHTGDLAVVDEAGYLYVVDRAKDFVKCGGKRVSFVQIEDKLLEFGDILEAAVIAIPDDVLGEAVKAFVVPRHPEAPGLPGQLCEFCKAKMTPSLIPKDIVLLRALPKSSAGKVLRQELKVLHAQGAYTSHKSPAFPVQQPCEVHECGRTPMQTRSALSLDVLKIDAAAETTRIQQAIRELVFQQLGRKGAVLGLSGGIDSSVTAALCAGALGRDRVFGLMMPEHDSSADSVHLGTLIAGHCGIEHTLENLTPALTALGCYERRDEAIRHVIPEYDHSWKSKIVLPNVLSGEGYAIFSVVAVSPEGKEVRARLTVEAYLGVVAATNFKQRMRKMLEYYHADKLQYAVAGTPNLLEYDQGFFVKLGDGAADFKPIAHLYKSQVYQLAEYLGIPQEIRRRPPTTDTYSLEQSQEEFYFSLPLAKMDFCLYGKNHEISAEEIAEALGLSPDQVKRVYRQIDAKRKMSRYLHSRPLLVSDSMGTEQPSVLL